MRPPFLPLAFAAVVVSTSFSRAQQEAGGEASLYPESAFLLEPSVRRHQGEIWKVIDAKGKWRFDTRLALALTFRPPPLSGTGGPVAATLVLPVEQFAMALSPSAEVMSNADSRVLLSGAPSADWRSHLVKNAIIEEDLRGSSPELASVILQPNALDPGKPIRLEWVEPDAASLAATLSRGLWLRVVKEGGPQKGAQFARGIQLAAPDGGAPSARVEWRPAE